MCQGEPLSWLSPVAILCFITQLYHVCIFLNRYFFPSQAAHFAYVKSHGERTHALALLANELSVIAKAEINEFVPVFSKWLPECMMISAMLLHRFYGERLVCL